MLTLILNLNKICSAVSGMRTDKQDIHTRSKVRPKMRGEQDRGVASPVNGVSIYTIGESRGHLISGGSFRL
jgi:hypothetical protein